ncbi:MAG: right-handed parallel beta-helix repeat-containing protein [Oscillospiraceae bacterium]|nr:right-handed parallel beta-helix repeat-containing protein [Oscillospiraceae bacterium]
MSVTPKSRTFLQALGALGIMAALAAGLWWYYDAFVTYWQPKAYPWAVLVVLLFAALMTLLTFWVRGDRGKTLARKMLISLAVFPGINLVGASFFINYVIYGNQKHGAAAAWSVVLPLSVLSILLQCAHIFTALRKRGRGAWVIPAGLLAAALTVTWFMWIENLYFIPQKELVPVFPEEQAARELLPYDEGAFDMQPGDILADSMAQAREELNKRTAPAITVWLKGGTYTGSSEFTGLKNVTFRNVPGEEAIFSGSAEIVGWSEDTVNGTACWSVAYDGYFTSLYHPDPEKQLQRPRYPAEGYLFVDHAEGARAMFTKETAPWELTRGHTSFFAKDGDLRQFHAMEDVALRVLHAWKDEITNLVSYDDTSRELVWLRPASMTVQPNDRYFLENVFEELKEPGQWYLDRAAGKLYYIPFEGESMADTVLYAGMHERLLTLDNAENVTFRGITFKNTAWNMPVSDGNAWPFVEGMDHSQAAYNVHPCILVTNSAGVNFEGCKFENIGATALKFAEGVHDSAATDCEFTYIGGNAVYIHGDFSEPNSNITVKNNLIAHYGRRFFNAIGVLNIHANRVEIANNEIYDGYYTAISSGWVWGYGENPTDYVSIENNLIHNIGQGWLSDMGGIYTLGRQENSVIRGNVIHDVAADPLQGGYGGWGIYPDEGSTGQLIEKNLVYDCGSQGFHQHYGKENLVRNNIFAFSEEGQVRVSRKEEHTSIFLEGNIIVSDGRPIYANVKKGKFIDGGNLYYDYAEPGKLFSGDEYEMGILKMRRKGYYKKALVADPLFRDIEARDFTLAVNSPAIAKLGFEVWDYNEAGRR